MASQYVRLMEPMVLSGSKQSETERVADLGAYKTLEVEFLIFAQVDSGVTSFELKLQHASVNEEDAFVDLSGATVSLKTGATSHVSVSNFLRYVRWVSILSGSITTPPVVGIDIVAKE